MTRTLLILLALGATACDLVIPDGGVDCTAMAASSVQVTLADPDGRAVTDAVVQFEHDGEVRDCEGTGQDWVCGWEIEGELTITVSADGFQGQSHVVDVPADACHVQTQFLDLTLEPIDCPPIQVWGVEVTTVSAAGEVIPAQVEWMVYGEDWTNPEPCEDWGDGMYACAPGTGGEVEIWASNREHGSFYTVVDVPMGECGPITQQLTAVVDRDPNN